MSKLVHNTININVVWLRRLWKTFLPHQYWWSCRALQSGALFKDLWEEWLWADWEKGEYGKEANGIFGQHISDGGAGWLPPWPDEIGARRRCSGTHPICLHALLEMKEMTGKKLHSRGSGNVRWRTVDSAVGGFDVYTNCPVLGHTSKHWFRSSHHDLTDASYRCCVAKEQQPWLFSSR